MDFTHMVAEKSDLYFCRQEFLEHLSLPTISEATESLKNELANIVFEKSHDVLKNYLGIEPPLIGTNTSLWISPSDLLIGKLTLKPPFTEKCLQSLTHHGILEIGEQIERKYRDLIRRNHYRALEEQRDILEKLFKVREERLIERIRKEEFEKKVKEIDGIVNQFELRIVEILQGVGVLIEKHHIEFEKQDELWKQKMRERISQVTQEITKEFLSILRRQEKILVAIFQQEIKKLENKKKQLLKQQEEKFEDRLNFIVHSLKCKNITNLIFILCKERRKCLMEKALIKAAHKKQLRELAKRPLIDESVLHAERAEWMKKMKIRDEFLMGVLREFQKFINFALKSCPTQGEFLLSIEKILAQYTKLIPPPEPIVKKVSKPPSVVTESIEEIEEEESIISSESSYSSDLPAFTYKNVMYVREDYRDLLLQDIDLKDKKPYMDEIKELMSVLEQISDDKDEKSLSSKKYSLSNVHFDYETGESIDTGSKKSSGKSDEITSSINYEAIGKVEREKSLIATSDSIDYMKQLSPTEKKSSNLFQHLPDWERKVSIKQEAFADADYTPIFDLNNIPDKSLLSMARDSIILTKAVNEITAINNDQLEVPPVSQTWQRRLSKIVTHCDSMDIIRSTYSLQKMYDNKYSISKSEKKGRSTVNFINKPNEFVVVGDQKDTEHLTDFCEKFARTRAKSFVDLIKDNDSLIDLFTSCG